MIIFTLYLSLFTTKFNPIHSYLLCGYVTISMCNLNKMACRPFHKSLHSVKSYTLSMKSKFPSDSFFLTQTQTSVPLKWVGYNSHNSCRITSCCSLDERASHILKCMLLLEKVACRNHTQNTAHGTFETEHPQRGHLSIDCSCSKRFPFDKRCIGGWIVSAFEMDQ
eukprot:TRINITY_DN1870_c0_g2_i2.p2 TRINITY_DN1870_c0_g2~~TRINITY_DN1870_c0_g2_i2.p2  ORF type:complete len:166 (-),score=5.40 TRINITY_DN1870_c0_g2_i2:160-657(-)